MRVVLCVGDSHTFGAGVEAAESYPAQLQVRLDDTYPEAHARVVNRGVPRVNTRYVVGHLGDWILELDYQRGRSRCDPHDAPIVRAAGPDPTVLPHGLVVESMLPVVGRLRTSPG